MAGPERTLQEDLQGIVAWAKGLPQAMSQGVQEFPQEFAAGGRRAAQFFGGLPTLLQQDPVEGIRQLAMLAMIFGPAAARGTQGLRGSPASRAAPTPAGSERGAPGWVNLSRAGPSANVRTALDALDLLPERVRGFLLTHPEELRVLPPEPAVGRPYYQPPGPNRPFHTVVPTPSTTPGAAAGTMEEFLHAANRLAGNQLTEQLAQHPAWRRYGLESLPRMPGYEGLSEAALLNEAPPAMSRALLPPGSPAFPRWYEPYRQPSFDVLKDPAARQHYLDTLERVFPGP